MQVKCIHEVYFEPKMFETIGFHHQATNQKTYGYPITNSKKTMQKNTKQIMFQKKNEQKSFWFNTNKFDVSFNEQQLFFDTSCRFKIQIDHIPYQNPKQAKQATKQISEQFKSQKKEKKKLKQPLYLEMKLIKYNKQTTIINKTIQEQKGMYSTENIIKNAVDDFIKEEDIQKNLDNQSQQKVSKLGQKKIKKEKQIQEVSQVTLQIDINLSLENRQSVRQMYQQILIPEQHYFGKLYFLISHTRLGYAIRAKNLTLLQFHLTRQSIISASSIEQKPALKNNKARISQMNLKIQKEEGQDRINVMNILQAIFPDACDLFQQLIREQIIELNRIEKLLNYLINELQHQQNRNSIEKPLNISSVSTQSTRNSLMSLNSYLKKSQRVEVCIPDSIMRQEDLFQYYQCEDREELYAIMYDEHRKLSNLINYKWLDIVSILSQKQWNSFYYYQTILNFRETNQYIAENKVHQELITTLKLNIPSRNKQYMRKINFIPNLKYKFYIYKYLPDIYIKKNTNPNLKIQPHTIISSNHVLFILVHGFNGNQHDMNRIKSFISYFSTPHFLVLKTISQSITQSLDNIGKIAAEQITQYLKSRLFIQRINFLGFSLGGVIIRACLPYLKKYHHLFNMLLTLSSPHLGVQQLNNCIVKTGLKLLNKIRRVKNIRQLMLDLNNTLENKEEDDQPEQKNEQKNEQQVMQDLNVSYLQKLAQNPSIRWFRIAIFCGSLDDNYVPGYSSTLDYLGQNQTITLMQQSLKRNITNLHQVYVKFNIKKKETLWDKVTGRRVHINFLDDDSFLHFLIGQYFHLF